MISKARFLELAKKSIKQGLVLAKNAWGQIKSVSQQTWNYLRHENYRERFQILWINIKTFKLKKVWRGVKKISKKISSSRKVFLRSVCGFLLVYYGLGSLFVENMNVTHTYPLPKVSRNKSEVIGTLAFLINREIDKKMWTPNLPAAFPAYVLDNMPNFQIGIITAVRDGAGTMRNFVNKTPEQQKHIKKAEELLRYSPYIWLTAKKGKVGLAPSANAQYRKARIELLKYNDEDFILYQADFETYLTRLSGALRRLIQKNDSQIIEHSSSLLDTKADDVFYMTRGYAFASWQIALAMGFDFKKLIVQYDVYNEWTYLLSSLQKAAEFKPLYVRNGKLGGIFGANHLLVQNYYLERALVAATQIKDKIGKSCS